MHHTNLTTKTATLLTLFIFLFLINYTNRNISIEFTIDKPIEGSARLYIDSGNGFNDDEKVTFNYHTNEIKVILNTHYIKALRFDPFDADGTIIIRNFRINGYHLSNKQLILKPVHSIETIERIDDDAFKITARGKNPHLILYENPLETLQWQKSNQLILLLFLLIIILSLVRKYTRLHNLTTSTQYLKPVLLVYNTLFTCFIITAYLLYLDIEHAHSTILSKVLFFDKFIYEYIIIQLFTLLLINRYRILSLVAIAIVVIYTAINIVQLNSFIIGGDFITPLALANAESINLLFTEKNLAIALITIITTVALAGVSHLLVIRQTITSILNKRSTTYIFWLSIVFFTFVSVEKNSLFYKTGVLDEIENLYKDNSFPSLPPIEAFIKIFTASEINKTITEADIKILKNNGFTFNENDKYPVQKDSIYFNHLNIRRSVEKPNIILILTEGLSARTSNVYSLKYKQLTPNLLTFSQHRNSLIIHNYFNHTAATYRGIAGNLCSIFPRYGGSDGWQDNAANIPSVNYKCLPRILANNGYETTYLNMLYKDYSGIDEMVSNFGFDHVISGERLSHEYLGGINKLREDRFTDHQSYTALQGYLNTKLSSKNPFFIALYTSETHAWIDVGEDGEKYGSGDNNALNTIYNMDHAFGEFWRYFINSDLAENTIIIFTADHSHYYEKSFVSAMKTHKENDYKKLFVDKIPLIIYDPTVNLESKTLDVNGATSLTLAPTILQYLDIPNEKNHFIGQSIFENNKQPNIVNYGNKTYLIKNSIVYGIDELSGEDEKLFNVIEKYIFFLKDLESKNLLYDNDP